jgi:hypothetical protein
MRKIMATLKKINGTFTMFRSYSDDPLIADLNKSPKDLDYYTIHNDKRNIRNDADHVYGDVKKAIKDRKNELNYQL